MADIPGLAFYELTMVESAIGPRSGDSSCQIPLLGIVIAGWHSRGTPNLEIIQPIDTAARDDRGQWLKAMGGEEMQNSFPLTGGQAGQEVGQPLALVQHERAHGTAHAHAAVGELNLAKSVYVRLRMYRCPTCWFVRVEPRVSGGRNRFNLRQIVADHEVQYRFQGLGNLVIGKQFPRRGAVELRDVEVWRVHSLCPSEDLRRLLLDQQTGVWIPAQVGVERRQQPSSRSECADQRSFTSRIC